jgi:acetyl esterase/lipase
MNGRAEAGGGAKLDRLRARIAALGSELSPDLLRETRDLLGPLALRPEAVGCVVTRDIAYGDHPRHRLDMFAAETLSTIKRPLLAYVHGGGFVGGDKGGAGAFFYNNVGAWAVAHGFVGVTMTYRLAPESRWPGGSRDIAAAIAWLRAHAPEFGGDPDTIFLVGQSAGAAHVASYVSEVGLHDRGRPLAGAVMLSGIYDLERFERGPFEDAYYGNDPAQMEAMSSLRGLVKTKIPCLFGVAQRDPASFQKQALLLVEAWFSARGGWPDLLSLIGHNHLSPAMLIGSAYDTVGPELEQFILRNAADGK